MERISLEAVVVGAGVIGLACAARLGRLGLEVTVLEAEPGFGRHASSRNSEVLHAGFYYQPGSLKAEHCRRGRALLLKRARERGIPFQLCGKLVLAQDDRECEKLEALLRQGQTNAVTGLSLITEKEVHSLEPELSAVAALYSAESGIVDSHALMQDLIDEIASTGGQVIYHSPVKHLRPGKTETIVEVGGDDPSEVHARYVVNAAGAHSLNLATEFDFGISPKPRLRLVRGHYLDYSGASPFKRLVYPVPEKDGLGIHATLDMSGRLRFGPDTMDVEELSYELPQGLAGAFARSVRRYWPRVEEEKLTGGYAGIRTKLILQDEQAPDFAVFGPERHGHEGAVHLLGIESPGLTAALSLADEVAVKLGLSESF